MRQRTSTTAAAISLAILLFAVLQASHPAAAASASSSSSSSQQPHVSITLDEFKHIYEKAYFGARTLESQRTELQKEFDDKVKSIARGRAQQQAEWDAGLADAREAEQRASAGRQERQTILPGNWLLLNHTLRGTVPPIPGSSAPSSSSSSTSSSSSSSSGSSIAVFDTEMEVRVFDNTWTTIPIIGIDAIVADWSVTRSTGPRTGQGNMAGTADGPAMAASALGLGPDTTLLSRDGDAHHALATNRSGFYLIRFKIFSHVRSVRHLNDLSLTLLYPTSNVDISFMQPQQQPNSNTISARDSKSPAASSSSSSPPSPSSSSTPSPPPTPPSSTSSNSTPPAACPVNGSASETSNGTSSPPTPPPTPLPAVEGRRLRRHTIRELSVEPAGYHTITEEAGQTRVQITFPMTKRVTVKWRQKLESSGGSGVGGKRTEQDIPPFSSPSTDRGTGATPRDGEGRGGNGGSSGGSAPPSRPVDNDDEYPRSRGHRHIDDVVDDEDNEPTPTSTVVHDTVHTIDDGLLQSTHSFTYSVDAGLVSLGHVEIAIHGTARVTSVTGHGVQSWRAVVVENSTNDNMNMNTPNDATNTTTLTTAAPSTQLKVAFKNSLMSDTIQLLVTTETEIGPNSDNGDVVTLPVAECVNVLRQTGTFGVVKAANVEVYEHATKGVARASLRDLKEELRHRAAGSPIVLAYKYLSPQHHVALSVIHHEEEDVIDAVVEAGAYSALVVDSQILHRFTLTLQNVRLLPTRTPALRTLHTQPLLVGAPCTHALSHTRHKCLVPNAFAHSLRSLAHLAHLNRRAGNT